MKATNKFIYQQLNKLYDSAKDIKVKPGDRIVIFSDLHMGDGSNTDDFKTNAALFTYILKNYYLSGNYNLVLNGDIEELQRYPKEKIYHQWREVIDLFSGFGKKLYKTIGNHDLQLSVTESEELELPVQEALRLIFDEGEMFVFHGHQASKKYQRHNQLVGFTLKYFANPLGIKNYSVSHNSRKQFKIEKIAYHYSAYKKIVSVIGHTHRPLFESLHKRDRIRFKIEQLCREFAESKNEKLIKSIKALKKSLRKTTNEENFEGFMYNSLLHLPCLFNSGTVIGKRGMTCLEIQSGKISLVHWFDKNISMKYLKSHEIEPYRLEGTDYYRMVINTDDLDYIFARVKLLS
ncbi:MAG: metallophosphoesterase [Cyclobacteriaceae bacterium]